MKTNSKRKVILQCLVALTMLAAALLSPEAALAQDTTPEGGAETQTTEEPTAVPTEIPTEVSTEIPTEEPTGEATEEPTEVPTEIATEETPTAEATLTPTITPTEGVISAQVTVTLTSPTGNIHTSTPYFIWDQLEYAYKYELFVYQVSNKGRIKMYDIAVKDSTYCNDDTGECKYKPSTSLKYGTYEWNLRAYYDDGTYTDFNETPMTFTYSSLVPTLKSPNTTVYDNPPEFSWTEVGDATLYQIQIYNKKGTKVLDDATITPTCADVDGESICTFTPGDTFDYGWYKWRLRAYYGTSWRSYTAYTSFIVAPDDISTSFDSYSPDWVKHGGANWTLGTVDGNTAYWTYGGTQYWTSLRNAYQYSDFQITANVKRDAGTTGEDGSYAASYIGVRMGASKGSSYTWYTGYIFGFTNAGTYSVWRMDSGSKAVAIQPWTEITGTFNAGDWNTLTVSADGDDFEFSINGDSLITFTDDTYSKGYIGFEMYRTDSTISRFAIDEVAFTDLSATSLSSTGVSAEQAAANLAALSSGDNSSFTTYEGGVISAQATTPTQIEPVDTTVYVSQPTFKWNDTGDSRYYLYLAKITTAGIVKVSIRSIEAATYCDGAECTYKYPSTLSKNDYLWKIKSYDGTDTSAYSDAQYFTVGTTQPTAKQPYSVIYDDQPTFTWTEIFDAEKYNIVAYDSDSVKVVDLWPEASAVTCDSEHICSVELEDFSTTPGWVTPGSLETGKYKWRVRALYNSKWGVYSAYREFTVASDFSSDFESDSTGWSRLWGGSWARTNGYYYTYGSANVMSALRYAYSYSDFTFTARVKREIPNAVYSSSPANYLAVRMGTSKTSSGYQWYPGYIFGYTNQGYYSIWRMKSGGGMVAIQPWTQISGDFYAGDWNELSVTADGNTFEFSINGTVMTSFTDDNYSKGYVGFEIYRPGSAFLGKFYVDSASLSLLGSTGLSALSADTGETVLSAEQQALNEAALAAGESGSIEGTSF